MFKKATGSGKMHQNFCFLSWNIPSVVLKNGFSHPGCLFGTVTVEYVVRLYVGKVRMCM
jgi:hypothetical protein